MSIIQIQEVTTEKVTKGKNFYFVANVVYTDNGKNFTKKVMSFANPKVFETLKNAAPGAYDVTVTKDGDYYNWSAIVPAGAAQQASNGVGQVMPQGGRVIGSNYETADERKSRQLLIVKQSSITNAIASYGDDIAGTPIDHILERAQLFVDFVYGVDEAMGQVDGGE